MSLDLASVVRKVTVVILGGGKFKFTELTLGDMAQFRARVQEQRKETRAERRDRLLEDAKAVGNIDPMEVLKMLDKPPTEDEYDDAAETIEGAVYLAYLSLKHLHLEITEDDVKNIVSVSNLEEVVQAMAPGEDKKKPKSLKDKRSRGALQSQSSSAGTKGRLHGKTSPK